MKLWISDRMGAYALLAQALGLADCPPFARSAWGKPCLPQSPQVEFNLSHSGPYVLCGVSDAPVGVDIEVIRPRHLAVVRGSLSPEEYRWYVSGGSRWEDFYSLWTMKEAKVKQAGTGITHLPRTLSVPLIRPGQSALYQGLWYRVYGDSVWRGALCATEQGPCPIWV